MKLIKLWATISLFFIFTFSSFADLTVDQYKDLLRQSRDNLIATTAQLEEANNEIISLETEISDYESAIEIKDDLLRKAATNLEDSNEKLEASNTRIADDQIEIEDLRGNLQTCIDNIQEVQMFTLGGGYSVYPQGLQLIFMFDIPKIPISVYTTGGVNFNPFGLNFTIGAAYRF